MRFNVFWLTFICVLFGIQFADAQIGASGAVWTGETNYSQSGNDPVFCFNSPAGASLTYEVPGGGGNYSFTWYRYQAEGNTWETPVSSGSGTSSIFVVQEPGGYRVVAKGDSGDEVEAKCWVFFPGLSEAKLDVIYADCFSVELQASADSIPLKYYDPATGIAGYMAYQRVYTWTVTPAQTDQKTGSRVSMDAPVEDVTYMVSVSDRFGNSREESSKYEAIAVDADFEAKIMKPEVLNERHTEVMGSAPLEVRFTDKSKGNITGWEWTFGASGRAAEANPFFVFTKAGRDEVVLRVVNRNSGCEDSSEPLMVTVSESELDVPNVFSPNGDGANDEFRVAYRSLKKFEMVVYNRWGRKVYQSSNPAEGWDGSIGSKLAAPGVYFYYITAEGYNPGEKYKRKGPVHLLRGKK